MDKSICPHCEVEFKTNGGKKLREFNKHVRDCKWSKEQEEEKEIEAEIAKAIDDVGIDIIRSGSSKELPENIVKCIRHMIEELTA